MHLSLLIKEINNTDLQYVNVEIGTRQEYSVEYAEFILSEYEKLMKVDVSTFVYGSGKRKTTVQKHYEKLADYLDRLKKYAHHIKTCGDSRNSYSKTDPGATFMRNKSCQWQHNKTSKVGSKTRSFISHTQKTKIFHKTRQRPQQVRSLSVSGTFFTAPSLFTSLFPLFLYKEKNKNFCIMMQFCSAIALSPHDFHSK